MSVITNRRLVYVFYTLLVVFPVAPSLALDLKPAAPYTQEALKRLAEASKAMTLESRPNAKTKSEAAEMTVRVYDKMYDKAGYSFDKTLIDLAKHIRNNGGHEETLIVAFREPFVIHLKVVAELIDINKQESLKPYMKAESYKALMQIAALYEQREKDEQDRENARQAELAKHKATAAKEAVTRKLKEQELERQHDRESKNVLQAYVGHYEFTTPSRNLEGTLDVKSISDSDVQFSIRTTNNRGGTCACEDKTAAIENPDSLKVLYDPKQFVEPKYHFSEGRACDLSFKFQADGSIEIWQGDLTSCKDYCSPAYVKMGGLYTKSVSAK